MLVGTSLNNHPEENHHKILIYILTLKETSSSGSWILSGKVISGLNEISRRFQEKWSLELRWWIWRWNTDRTIFLWFKESRYCKWVQGRVRGSLPWLGCFACKHLTWIFRSLVSPGISVSPACRAQTGRGRAQSWAQSLFCPEQSLSQSGQWLGSAWPRLAAARSRFPSVKISPEASTEPGTAWMWARARAESSGSGSGVETGDSVTADPSSWHHCESLTSNPPFAGLRYTP